MRLYIFYLLCWSIIMRDDNIQQKIEQEMEQAFMNEFCDTLNNESNYFVKIIREEIEFLKNEDIELYKQEMKENNERL